MAKYAFQNVKAEYARLWASMVVKPGSIAAANKQARAVIAGRPRYEKVEATTGVPWFVVGCMHMREAGLTKDGHARFDRWLHNGDPMRDRNGRGLKTVRVPANRPPNPNVDWETGAYDALVTIKHYDQIKDWGPERVAYANESFNGWGYRNPRINIPSPYLWGGTNQQKLGKYIRDGVYDANTWDTQLGAMAVLKQIMELCPDARFKTAPRPEPVKAAPVAVAPEAPQPVPNAEVVPSPRADDIESEVKPLAKSKSIWSGIGQAGLSVGGAVSGAIAYLNNPYALGAFGIVAGVALVLLYLNIRGYIDIRNVVKHLSDDEE